MISESRTREQDPTTVELHLGDLWVTATAHARRDSRQGRQVLVGHHDHLLWVAAHRVRPAPSHGDATADSQRPSFLAAM